MTVRGILASPDWWGVEHSCGGVERVYPTLHWADEPEKGAGPRQAFECDACGNRYAFYEKPHPKEWSENDEDKDFTVLTS